MWKLANTPPVWYCVFWLTMLAIYCGFWYWMGKR